MFLFQKMNKSHTWKLPERVAYNADVLKLFWEKKIELHAERLQSEDVRMHRAGGLRAQRGGVAAACNPGPGSALRPPGTQHHAPATALLPSDTVTQAEGSPTRKHHPHQLSFRITTEMN